MRILIILAHPVKQSFNHAIAETARKKLLTLGHEVIYHDLYAENFPALLPAGEISRDGLADHVIQKHCDELQSADGILIVHPNWWGMPPAILKGWIDRVLRPGVAYEFQEGDPGEGIPKGLLKARTAIVLNTSNTNKDREENIFLDPLETIWKNCICYLCGINIFHRKMFRILITSTEQQRRKWLAEVEQILTKHFS
ncbi:MAG: NAD(P)H-dependent oxidoreductase [Bacteroidales bacterium]|nr:NAD(P)H-dependent oxidoreductase [Bacteroidales bacterium]